jgi:hypothetical protein
MEGWGDPAGALASYEGVARASTVVARAPARGAQPARVPGWAAASRRPSPRWPSTNRRSAGESLKCSSADRRGARAGPPGDVRRARHETPGALGDLAVLLKAPAVGGAELGGLVVSAGTARDHETLIAGELVMQAADPAPLVAGDLLHRSSFNVRVHTGRPVSAEASIPAPVHLTKIREPADCCSTRRPAPRQAPPSPVLRPAQ